MADLAAQATEVTRPGIERPLDRRTAQETKPNSGYGGLDRADRTQRSPCLRIEPFEGLREATVSFSSDGPEQVLGSIGVGGLNLLHRSIEVSEDPTDFLFQELEARRTKTTDRVAAPFSELFRPQAVGRFQLRRNTCIGGGDEPGVRRDRIDLPCGARVGTDCDKVKLLSLLVRHEGHTEGQQEERRFTGFQDLDMDTGR